MSYMYEAYDYKVSMPSFFITMSNFLSSVLCLSAFSSSSNVASFWSCSILALLRRMSLASPIIPPLARILC